MVRTIGTVVGNLESRILETVEREVGERLKRVEENEQLSSRVHVEKKDEVRVLDAVSYTHLTLPTTERV